MNTIDHLVEAIKGAFRWLKNIVHYVIQGVLNFVKEVVNWFRRLHLNKDEDIPFVADAERFKSMLKTAPKKNVGIFEGVYNEETDEITAHRFLDADEVDNQTREVLGNESLVVLN